ncbi:MAG: GntR family transcriptional regulator [Ruminococcus flavefaciens]|nr:GntR family transcriptional regulator [Ruminococcus flavefaciens]MCM1231629.1 GntR family transcriptional regulator [Ruminococcus flavefaciens]
MFSIDLTSRIPIYEQIYNKIIELAVSGTLAENEQLPSVRSLAKDTGVNPNTVAKAYQELERKGVVYSVPGRGSFVSAVDSSIFRETALADFDKSAVSAIKHGISAEALKNRIDGLAEQHRKGD